MSETPRLKIEGNLASWVQRMDADHPDLFPESGGAAYYTRYAGLSSYLSKHVHTEVEQAAILAQLRDGALPYDRALYLTHHGPGHVKQVIERASDLCRELALQLSPYEGYLLLAAIHFHDVGNALGREEHEKKCFEVMSVAEVSGFLGDSTEKRVIAKIAAAHGGMTDSDGRDTISVLLPADERYGQEIRPQFLAALLRFADELADDRSRASRFMLEAGRLPPSSEVFHEYSFALQSVRAVEREISLSFEIQRSKAIRTYHRDGQQVFLLDEIYSRVQKMHQERMYCMRFWPHPYQTVRSIRARVEVYGDTERDFLADPIRTITFSLSEAGYPDSSKDECDLCLGLDPNLPSGKFLKGELEEVERKEAT
ncbi:MAG: hypothetical protein ABSH10_02665 [Phycisphaerae bacterium]|jgi:hypothetical protein